jgi:hypothetical protein
MSHSRWRMSAAMIAAISGLLLGNAGSASADAPIVRTFEFVAGDESLLVGTLPDADIRAVAAGAPATGLDAKVLLGSPELGLGHLWVIVQMVTDQTCNAQGECNIRVLHSSPNGYMTVADVMAIDVAWIEDGSEPVTLLFAGLQGPAIWRWNGSAYAFDRIGDDDLMDAYYAATGGDTY